MDYCSNDYGRMNQSWHIEDSPWKAKQILKLVNKHEINFKTVCEVGCGAGEILNQLHNVLSDEHTFVGYDIAPSLEEKWKERNKPRLKFINQDFLKSEDYYDLLMMIDVVEHVEDYIYFLRNVKTKGKYKVFNFPLEIFAVKALLGHKYVQSKRKYGHIHYFNKDIILSMLDDLGYKVIDSFYAPGAVELSATSSSISLSSRMLKIPRLLLSKISHDFTAKTIGGYSLFILAE